MPRGQQSSYTDEIAEEILRRLEGGEALIAICRTEGFPSEASVRRWVTDDKEGFASKYAHARDLGLDHVAEEVLEIADDGRNDTYQDEEGNVKVNTDVINRSRLRFDARRWYLAKLAPKRYGDNVNLKHSGDLSLSGLLRALDGPPEPESD